MGGRVIQSSGPLRYAILEGIDVHDSRVHNYPPRWNGAPNWCEDPILAPADYVRWLSEEPDPHELMRPFPAEPMRMWPISTRVNRLKNDDPFVAKDHIRTYHRRPGGL